MKRLILCAVLVGLAFGAWSWVINRGIQANEESYRKGNREFILNISGASPLYFDEDISPRIHRFRKRP